MYIVIAGGGLIGTDLTRELLDNRHDVIVIDRDKEVCDWLYSNTGAIAVHGAMTRMAVLREARMEKADVAVAATGNDADNLTFAILAKSLGVPLIIARMRDPEYEKAYRAVGVDRIVRVTDLMVNHLIMEVERPDVRRLTTIAGGRADVFLVDIPEGAAVAGRQIREIAQDSSFPSECVIIAAYRPTTDEFAIPRGDRVVSEGDQLFLIASAADITSVTEVLTSQTVDRGQ